MGNAVATVAHTEVTPEMLESWIAIYGHDIAPAGPRVQPIECIRERMEERCVAMHNVFTDRLYDAWLARIRAFSAGKVAV